MGLGSLATLSSLSSLDASDGSPTQALAVDALGNVGVGTTSPDALFDVEGNMKVEGKVINDSGNMHIMFINPHSYTENSQANYFDNSAAVPDAGGSVRYVYYPINYTAMFNSNVVIRRVDIRYRTNRTDGSLDFIDDVILYRGLSTEVFNYSTNLFSSSSYGPITTTVYNSSHTVNTDDPYLIRVGFRGVATSDTRIHWIKVYYTLE